MRHLRLDHGVAQHADAADLHFHPWQDNQGHSGQAWITLAALGERTRSIRLGTAVLSGRRGDSALASQ